MILIFETERSVLSVLRITYIFNGYKKLQSVKKNIQVKREQQFCFYIRKDIDLNEVTILFFHAQALK